MKNSAIFKMYKIKYMIRKELKEFKAKKIDELELFNNKQRFRTVKRQIFRNI